jgi:hypothetical protein
MPRDIKDAPTQEQIQAAQETLLTRTADAARLGGGSATDEALREPTPEEAAAQRTLNWTQQVTHEKDMAQLTRAAGYQL